MLPDNILTIIDQLKNAMQIVDPLLTEPITITAERDFSKSNKPIIFLVTLDEGNTVKVKALLSLSGNIDRYGTLLRIFHVLDYKISATMVNNSGVTSIIVEATGYSFPILGSYSDINTYLTIIKEGYIKPNVILQLAVSYELWHTTDPIERLRV